MSGDTVTNGQVLEAFRPWRHKKPSSHANNIEFLDQYLCQEFASHLPVEEFEADDVLRSVWKRSVVNAEGRLRVILKHEKKRQNISPDKVRNQFFHSLH